MQLDTWPCWVTANAGPPTFFAFCVLQAEAGFVPFSHPGPVERQEVVVREDIHAVVVPETGEARA